MKITELDARTKAGAGVEMHLRNHITDEPLLDGDKPLIVLVKGTQARMDPEAVRAGLIAQGKIGAQLRKMKQAIENGEEPDPVIFEEVHRAKMLQALPYVAGFKNVEMEDGRPATVDDALTVLDLTRWRAPTEDKPGRSFAQQVLDFVAEADAALGNG